MSASRITGRSNRAGNFEPAGQDALLSTTTNNCRPPPSSRPTSRQSLTGLSSSDAKGPTSRKAAPGPNLSTATPTRPRTTRITATTTTSRTFGIVTVPASQPQLTPRPAREPLRLRDQNAAPTTRSVRLTQNPKSQPSATIATKTTRSTMPFERASAISNNRQPQMPTLARAGVNKQPLTPKVASRSATQQQQAVTITTPLPRRAPRPESTLSNYGGAQKERDEVASPVVSAFLSNITPRSGSRQSRVDSANSTPTGTPQPDRYEAAWETKSGLGIPGLKVEDNRPSVTFSPSDAAAGHKPAVEVKFFYASDAPKQARYLLRVRDHSSRSSRSNLHFSTRTDPRSRIDRMRALRRRLLQSFRLRLCKTAG